MSEGIKLPFDYKNKEEFSSKLADWIGEVFYDILSQYGYEVREEQVYTAFQLADAVCHNKVHLAEAALGTGKTFAYLLTAIAYARFKGKPVVIACASTALQEQLAGPKGDIQTLSSLLGLKIDARMAKDPRQYVCDAKVIEAGNLFEENTTSNDIHLWLEKTRYGERSEMPFISDHVWKQIGWDESLSCEMCSSRGFCKHVKARKHYGLAKDLIIVDHGVFFQDLWTREEKLSEGKSPMLPDYSAVIFDEGHKVNLPALIQAGQKVDKEIIENMILSLQQIQGARKSLLKITFSLESASSYFFEALYHYTIEDKKSERLALRINDSLLKAAGALYKVLESLLLELQIEQELYTESIPLNLLQTYESQIERTMLALNRFYKYKAKDVLTWVDVKDGSFWVVPRYLNKMLNQHLFQKKLPVVFTSATLSNEGNFDYFTRILGLKKTSSSSVPSPFDLEEKVVVHLYESLSNSSEIEEFSFYIEELVYLLKENGGKALVLTDSLYEVQKIRQGLKKYSFPFEVLWEDQGERGYLVGRFREEVSSVLVGTSFWEGIDVPGESLSLLVIWKLPFPSLDPLIEAQRKEAKEEGLDPMISVDYPEMGLKLKQGCGRLIRTEKDEGSIAIMEPVIGTPWEKVVMGSLPPEAKIKTKKY